MTQQNDRRDFLKLAAAAGAGFWIAGQSELGAQQTGRPAGPNERLNVASIGCGGQGGHDIGVIADSGLANIVALCDVDENRARGTFNRFPKARRFPDYRRMLDQMGNQIDAVVVSTPDNVHAHASIAAMLLRKHVYCQKPLTHDVWEARQMREVARRMNVKTQMGNQGTSDNTFREAVEVIRSGVLGRISEVHVWTNRPIWPQSEMWANRSARPLPAEQVPATLNWDLWQGPAQERAYNHAYLPFSWRGFWDYGTGAIGDMACHTMNLPFFALNLEAPSSVSAQLDDRAYNRNDQTAPYGAIVTYQFEARGNQPAFTMKWYERNYPVRELFLGAIPAGQNPNGSGCLIIGSQGTLYSPHDYGGSYRLLSREANRFRDYRPPQPTLRRNGGNHYREWLESCRGGPVGSSNFNYASKLTECALLGNVAMRVCGRFTWNAEELTTNLAAANCYLRRDYRRGWELRTT
jgi:predicted dehydrogenase